MKRAERERDVLRAEKHVWTVAHSGAQAEMANLSAALERERQAHEDTRAALRRAKEGAHKVREVALGKGVVMWRCRDSVGAHLPYLTYRT